MGNITVAQFIAVASVIIGAITGGAKYITKTIKVAIKEAECGHYRRLLDSTISSIKATEAYTDEQEASLEDIYAAYNVAGGKNGYRAKIDSLKKLKKG